MKIFKKKWDLVGFSIILGCIGLIGWLLGELDFKYHCLGGGLYENILLLSILLFWIGTMLSFYAKSNKLWIHDKVRGWLSLLINIIPSILFFIFWMGMI